MNRCGEISYSCERQRDEEMNSDGERGRDRVCVCVKDEIKRERYGDTVA